MRQRRRSERETITSSRNVQPQQQQQQPQQKNMDPTPPTRNGVGDGHISGPISNPMPTNVGQYRIFEQFFVCFSLIIWMLM